MAKIYTKNTWVDEILAAAERYNLVNADDAILFADVGLALIPGVVQAGSPVTAARMNNIEDGIDGLDTLVDGILVDVATMAQDITDLQNAQQGTKNLWIGGWRPTLTSGCGSPLQLEMATNKNVIDCLPFDPSTAEYAYANVAMPDDWDEAPFTVKFYWAHPTTTTNFGVRWALQAVAVGDDDGLDAAWGTAQGVLDTGGSTNDLYISDATAAITAGGIPAAGKLVQFRVYRQATNAADTLAVDAYLVGVMITYGVN